MRVLCSTPISFGLGSGATAPPSARTKSLLWLFAGTYVISVVAYDDTNKYPMKMNEANHFEKDELKAMSRSPDAPETQTSNTDNALLVQTATILMCATWPLLIIGLLCHMYQGPILLYMNTGGNEIHGPPWNPAGSKLFRIWIQEVHTWLCATHIRLTTVMQAAAIQRGLLGEARNFSAMIPSEVIQSGMTIGGLETDPVASLLHILATRFGVLEEDMGTGCPITNFKAKPFETVDALLARYETRVASTRETNYLLIATALLRASGVDGEQTSALLQSNGNRLPRNREQYETMVARLREMGHAMEQGQEMVQGDTSLQQALRAFQMETTRHGNVTSRDASGSAPSPTESQSRQAQTTTAQDYSMEKNPHARGD